MLNCQKYMSPEEFETISDTIWGYAEPRFQEKKSAALLLSVLKECGFEVHEGIAGMPTAFSGEFGTGKPVIAILGEYDALFSMSQKADVCEKQVDPAMSCGHACGHHLLGTGALEAAVSVKRWLEETNTSGTIRYYGCPAEEGGGGKIHMIRNGVFDDVDIALTWHAGSYNGIWNKSLAGLRSVFDFKGKSAHAAASPHLGRSALDAAELMNVGVNFLREHVTDDVRIHYAITDAGGIQPNIVQETAQVVYVVRADTLPALTDVYERLGNVAKGAALMTGTSVTSRVQTAYSSFLSNKSLDMVLSAIISGTDMEFTQKEILYGDQFAPTGNLLRKTDYREKDVLAGSTDVADVSWVVPTGQITVICSSVAALHSWQFCAQGKSSIAHKGMHFAAAVIEKAAEELFTHPELVKAAWVDFEKAKQGFNYHSLLPVDTKPDAY